jgi:hypothetical protein
MSIDPSRKALASHSPKLALAAFCLSAAAKSAKAMARSESVRVGES